MVVGHPRLVREDLLGPERGAHRRLARAAPAPRPSSSCGATGSRRGPAARAWTVTRTMLFSGCWAVSMLPAVWAWKRSVRERGSRAPKRSRMRRAQSRRAARNFATSSSRLLWALKKNESWGANSSTARPAAGAARHRRSALANVKATSCDRRASRLADVIPGDRDRVPARHAVLAERERVRDEPHGGAGREDVRAPGDVLLQDVVLHGAGQARRRHARRARPPPRRGTAGSRAVALIVIEVETRSSGMPSSSSPMSSRLEIATPTSPTSLRAIGVSAS